jgi:hypothetical protein
MPVGTRALASFQIQGEVVLLCDPALGNVYTPITGPLIQFNITTLGLFVHVRVVYPA